MTEQPEACEFCQFKTPDLEAYTRAVNPRGGTDWLCHFCAATQAGTAHNFPHQFEGQLETLQAVCYIGNTLLAAIKAK